MKVKYSYLSKQFSNTGNLWPNLRKFVKTEDFTLGKPLLKFEKKFAKLNDSNFAVGVNSGTDAIKLSLKALGVGYKDEVITAANTFVATVGAIIEIGAKPVFVDCDDTFCMNVDLVEKKITKKTKAFLPVHYTGYMTDMPKLKKLALKYRIPIVEDACQSILASINNKKSGHWGDFAAFSLHPLKNLNVWSDGGIITTNNKKHYNKLLLLRNHGLKNRDEVLIPGYNSRLDTFQAVIGNWIIPKAKIIAQKRINNAKYLDEHLSKIAGITIPPRKKNFKIVFHLYIVFAQKRDLLLKHCIKKGIETKIHYPIPIYKQKAYKYLKNKHKNFPITNSHLKKIITFPCDQHKSKRELDYIIKTVKEFYK